MNVAICVPRRAGIADRDRLWEFCRDKWATDFPDWPIFEGTSPDGPFNRGAAINDAVALAGERDVYLIVDADVAADPAQVLAAVERASETGRLTRAYTQYRAMSQHTTEKVLEGYDGSWEPGSRPMKGHVSSILACPVGLWDDTRGFDERVKGWAHDDIIFDAACRVLGGGIEAVDGIVWHLWHKPAPDAKKGQPNHRAAAALAKRYHEAVWPDDMDALIAEREGNGACLVVLTHGRRDCILESVQSFRDRLKGLAIDRIIISDDSRDPDYQAWLRRTFDFIHFDLVIGDRRSGQGFAANCRRAWEAALGSGQEWIFWLEDDFTLTETVDLAAMAAVMEANPHLTQMMLKRQPWTEAEVAAGGYMEQRPDAYTERTDGENWWCEHQLGHWTNPHLVHRDFLAQHEWPMTTASEARFARQVMHGDTRAGIWGKFTDPPRVIHDGARTGTGY